ncbi:MAG: FCD domain-containing protein [Rhizobiaceae bacterium]|jgi:GntR family transcriptional regulator, carbon starvation induced regulator
MQTAKARSNANEGSVDDPNEAALLSDAALGALREDILSGELPPNTRLRMAMLHKRYNIGASPLREALSRLVADNLVVALQRRGFAVAPVSLDDFRDLTNLRKLLEKEALVLSLQNGDDKWEAGVVAAYHQLNRVQGRLEPNNPEGFNEWEALNQAFHDALVAACGSVWLLRARNTAYICSERYRRICLSIKSISRDVRAEHEELLNAALARDVEAIKWLISKHLEATYQKVLESGRLDNGPYRAPLRS